jgi:RNA polymerase primary sigma factor
LVAIVQTATLGAVIPDDPAIRSLIDAVGAEGLELLPAREQEFLRLRFGLEDGRISTREEVGQEYGLMPERVLQIESKALSRLRRLDATYLPREHPE